MFATLTYETENEKFPTFEKEALLEPFYFLLKPWIFCNKNENHKSGGGISIERFIEISKPEDHDGLQEGLEDYFQGGVPVIGCQCPYSGNKNGEQNIEIFKTFFVNSSIICVHSHKLSIIYVHLYPLVKIYLICSLQDAITLLEEGNTRSFLK